MDRQSSSSRGYGARWQKVRLSFLRNNPLCAECYKIDALTAATVVDHIEPHKGDQSLFWDQDNWQSLCKQCHDRKTAREDGAFGNKGETKPTAACGLSGVPVDGRHHWNKKQRGLR